MRDRAIRPALSGLRALPRGWVILGAAVASWALVIAVGAGIAQMYAFVVAAI